MDQAVPQKDEWRRNRIFRTYWDPRFSGDLRSPVTAPEPAAGKKQPEIIGTLCQNLAFLLWFSWWWLLWSSEVDKIREGNCLGDATYFTYWNNMPYQVQLVVCNELSICFFEFVWGGGMVRHPKQFLEDFLKFAAEKRRWAQLGKNFCCVGLLRAHARCGRISWQCYQQVQQFHLQSKNSEVQRGRMRPAQHILMRFTVWWDQLDVKVEAFWLGPRIRTSWEKYFVFLNTALIYRLRPRLLVWWLLARSPTVPQGAGADGGVARWGPALRHWDGKRHGLNAAFMPRAPGEVIASGNFRVWWPSSRD